MSRLVAAWFVALFLAAASSALGQTYQGGVRA